MLTGGAHEGCPDKEPAARLAVLEAAGRARVPFTTGMSPHDLHLSLQLQCLVLHPMSVFIRLALFACTPLYGIRSSVFPPIHTSCPAQSS